MIAHVECGVALPNRDLSFYAPTVEEAVRAVHEEVVNSTIAFEIFVQTGNWTAEELRVNTPEEALAWLAAHPHDPNGRGEWRGIEWWPVDGQLAESGEIGFVEL